MTPTRVLVTGAAGLVGEALRPLLDEQYDVIAVDRRGAPGVRRADLARRRPLRRLFAGVDAVVDLAAENGTSISWRSAERNMRITRRVLEAARAHGVRRYVFASSNHVTGMYEHDEPYAAIVAGRYDGLTPDSVPLISSASPARPDSPYAVAKLFGEAAGRFYAGAGDMSVICLRIGTVRREDVPRTPRHFATLLSHRDLRQLVGCALEAPADVRYGVYYGVSNNRWRFWRIDDAEADLGYRPADAADSLR